MAESTSSGATQSSFDLALLSDIGTERSNNEDACGHFVEGPEAALFMVADGIGGYEGGEIASRMAVDITIEAYRESPPRGEIVLVVGAAPARRADRELALTAVRELIDAGARPRPAAAAVAKLTGLGANELYRELVRSGGQ